MRVFIGLLEIAGYYRHLRSGFEELGIEAVFVDFSQHPFQYGGASVPNKLVELAYQALAFSRRGAGHSRAVKALYRLPFWALRLLVFVWAAAAFDVFIFGFASSFLYAHLDLPILRLLGKRILFVFHGSDARPPYLDGAVMSPDRALPIEACLRVTRRRKRTVRRIERWASAVVSHPNYGQFHEKPFVNFMRVGFPYPAPAVAPVQRSARPVRLLHSPSHPESKGTYRFRAIVNELRARGYALEWVEITGRPNQEVMRELEQADLVIDQLYSDIFISGFGTEAAVRGRPVVIGGYGLETDRQAWPPEALPPTCMAQPDRIAALIEDLLRDPDQRVQAGEQARAFMVGNWMPAAVARRFIQILEDNPPAEWICQPREIRYIHGYGLPESALRRLLRQLIAAGGPAALQVADKPELERRLVDCAQADG